MFPFEVRIYASSRSTGPIWTYSRYWRSWVNIAQAAAETSDGLSSVDWRLLDRTIVFLRPGVVWVELVATIVNSKVVSYLYESLLAGCKRTRDEADGAINGTDGERLEWQSKTDGVCIDHHDATNIWPRMLWFLWSVGLNHTVYRGGPIIRTGYRIQINKLALRRKSLSNYY